MKTSGIKQMIYHSYIHHISRAPLVFGVPHASSQARGCWVSLMVDLVPKQVQVCVGKYRLGQGWWKRWWGRGANGSKVQTNSTRSILNKPPHFAFAFTSKPRLSEPRPHLSLQPFATLKILHYRTLLKRQMSSVEAKTALLSGAKCTPRQLTQVLFSLWNCRVYF